MTQIVWTSRLTDSTLNVLILFTSTNNAEMGKSVQQRHKHLSKIDPLPMQNQKCSSNSCSQCPLNNTKNKVVVNGLPVNIPVDLNVDLDCPVPYL